MLLFSAPLQTEKRLRGISQWRMPGAEAQAPDLRTSLSSIAILYGTVVIFNSFSSRRDG
jgi:antibiotic biosynthesis monooxygenase (ABM) superfamily enzyme